VSRDADRILTSHTGSLPRPFDIIELVQREERGEPFDRAELDRLLTPAVSKVVERQVAAGLDIVSDGEFSKASYGTYIQQRLTGFGEADPSKLKLDRNVEFEAFPEYYERTRSKRGLATRRLLGCIGPVGVADRKPLERDLANLKSAVAAHKPAGGGFMTAASPGVIARFQPNLYYDTLQGYRDAVATSMRIEYEAIVAAGFQLQVDCPDLASSRVSVYSHLSDSEFLRECEMSIASLNDALRNVPGDQVRLHVCWGNYQGPHIHDIELEKILPAVLQAKPRILSVEGANPRHGHEWEVFTRIKLPDDMVLMPGVIDSTTNFVEHPQLVAERICRYADAVGRERVIAGVDCGFETFAGDPNVDERIVYHKFASLAEGARIASERLWPRAARNAPIRQAGA
jgi:5-methyltetrahydropteroyltriglutamate--homocysteine methyltransferase